MRGRLTKYFALAVAATIASAAAAEAQTKSQGRPGGKREKEFLVGAVIAGPSSVGSSDATLLDGAGNPGVTLFRVENQLATGQGIESNIGIQLSRKLWVEVSGSWTRSNVNSKIRNDFENGLDETISSPMSRFTVEGGVVRYLRDKGRTAWFVRGGGGWMRETAGGNTLTGDGWIGNAGLGLRRWFRIGGTGSIRRIGFRFEGRAVVRSGGISLGEKGIRFGPAGTAHIVFGF